jgi:ligand-binding sensor domain-containing protein
LVGTYTRIKRLVDGRLEPYPVDFAREFRVRGLYRDREGSLWIGTTGQGLLHLHQGTVDVFAQSDGLSSDTAHHFFEDREGSLWAATENGLDRFRDFAIPTY